MPSGVYKRKDWYKREVSKRNKRLGILPPYTLGIKMSKAVRKRQSLRQKGKVPKCVRSGENHWRWIKDRTKLKKRQMRNDYTYIDFVRKVKKRDKNTCRINNKDCSGNCIVHHILGWAEFPELRYEVNNGITLCQAHHPRRRAEEKRLVPVFQELVSVSI